VRLSHVPVTPALVAEVTFMDLSVVGAVLFGAVIVVCVSLALLWASESGLQL
jgi:hypothetical protein